ncbi:MAG: hypothetical protein ABJO01_08250 [Parasphingorhabdus sp.]|uniref:hypothetical protein n=1 Tax=Parasphingorhabdus sp. TaxID=2709688 RepID=UPI0032970F0A
MKIRQLIMSTTGVAMVVLPVTSLAAHASNIGSHEKILTQPIANVENNFWFDYLSDIQEAEHELKKDLARATDDEDRADAVEEYRNEIADANKDYKKEMRERGYRVGRVTVGD